MNWPEGLPDFKKAQIQRWHQARIKAATSDTLISQQSFFLSNHGPASIEALGSETGAISSIFNTFTQQSLKNLHAFSLLTPKTLDDLTLLQPRTFLALMEYDSDKNPKMRALEKCAEEWPTLNPSADRLMKAIWGTSVEEIVQDTQYLLTSPYLQKGLKPWQFKVDLILKECQERPDALYGLSDWIAKMSKSDWLEYQLPRFLNSTPKSSKKSSKQLKTPSQPILSALRQTLLEGASHLLQAPLTEGQIEWMRLAMWAEWQQSHFSLSDLLCLQALGPTPSLDEFYFLQSPSKKNKKNSPYGISTPCEQPPPHEWFLKPRLFSGFAPAFDSNTNTEWTSLKEHLSRDNDYLLVDFEARQALKAVEEFLFQRPDWHDWLALTAEDAHSSETTLQALLQEKLPGFEQRLSEALTQRLEARLSPTPSNEQPSTPTRARRL